MVRPLRGPSEATCGICHVLQEPTPVLALWGDWAQARCQRVGKRKSTESYGLACFLSLQPGTHARPSDARNQLCEGKVESEVKQ